MFSESNLFVCVFKISRVKENLTKDPSERERVVNNAKCFRTQVHGTDVCVLSSLRVHHSNVLLFSSLLQPSKLIDALKTLRNFEGELTLKESQLNSLRIDASDLESVRRQLKGLCHCLSPA